MHIGLNGDHLMIQDTARKFAIDRLAAFAEKLDYGGAKDRSLDNLKAMAEPCFMGLKVESEFGGAECGVIVFSLDVTDIARACAATAVTNSDLNMVAELIATIGTDDQKREHLTRCGLGLPPVS